MKTSDEKRVEESKSTRTTIASTTPMDEQVSRAMEMMNRVKTSKVAQAGNAPEDQRMPSYLLPQPVILCPQFD